MLLSLLELFYAFMYVNYKYVINKPDLIVIIAFETTQ